MLRSSPEHCNEVIFLTTWRSLQCIHVCAFLEHCSTKDTRAFFRPSAGTFTGKPWHFSALITPAVFPTTNPATTCNIRTKVKDADSQRYMYVLIRSHTLISESTPSRKEIGPADAKTSHEFLAPLISMVLWYNIYMYINIAPLRYPTNTFLGKINTQPVV